MMYTMKQEIYYGIFELTPAPWGDDYRLIQFFDNRHDAGIVLKALEETNILFHCYKIVEYKKYEDWAANLA